MKHLICYSGGHSSALVAINVKYRYSWDNVILLNHNIHPSKEHPDIKRFKKEVADFLNLPITYANFNGQKNENYIPDQFLVCMLAGTFVNPANRQILCTSRLKTEPFEKYLINHCDPNDTIIYYGFDKSEKNRIERRRKILSSIGFNSEYPLAEWNNLDINNTTQINIEPPLTYSVFKHGNCLGCLKAGKQHWYVIYCLYPDIYQEGIKAEKYINHTIINEISLTELAILFKQMKLVDIEPTELISSGKFWNNVKRKLNTKDLIVLINNIIKSEKINEKPCECIM